VTIGLTLVMMIAAVGDLTAGDPGHQKSPQWLSGRMLLDVDFTELTTSEALKRGYDLKRVELGESGLFLNGRYEFGDDGYRAVIAVPHLDYSHFSFSMVFRGLDFEEDTSKLPEWVNHFLSWDESDPHTNLLTGGTSYRWMSIKVRDGHLALSLNNGEIQIDYPDAVLSPHQWHTVSGAIDLESSMFRLLLDGELVANQSLPEDFQMTVIGSSGELSDKQLTFTDYSNGETFHGHIARLEVLKVALSEEDLKDWYDSGRESHRRLPHSTEGNSLSAILLIPILGLLILSIWTGYRWYRHINRE
jgi:hypothetical protein